MKRDWPFGSWVVVLSSILPALVARGAEYRVIPSASEVLAGDTTSLQVEVETLAGDNVVGLGYFSFAIDLTVSGSAGAIGNDISTIVINTADFDDLGNSSTGVAENDRYVGVAGVTTDLFAPTFGEDAGDIVQLFSFDLEVPATAELGDTIMIMPSEGALENLIAGTFENVAPQEFSAAVLAVVPEPGTASLAVSFLALACLRRTRTFSAAHCSRGG